MKKKFPWLTGYQWTWVLYLATAIFCWQLKYFRHADNNYLVFREAWYHARAQLNLYAAYPKEYYDFYYYGPLFSLFVAPFAVPPESVAFFLWEVGNALAILLAVHMLPLSQKRKTQLLLLCAIEYANSVFYMQFNPMITAMIIISFVLIERGKEGWGTFLIVMGTFIKLYPIVGFTFFLFSKTNQNSSCGRQSGRQCCLWRLWLFQAPRLSSNPIISGLLRSALKMP